MVIKVKCKKILPLFAAVSCILCGCRGSDPMENFYGYYYVSAERGEIAISSCSLVTEEIRIPGEISGQRVVAVDGGISESGSYTGAFEACPGTVKRIIIPEGTETIGERVFADSVSLENVLLPESLTRLGEYAFSGCEGLTDMEIPQSVAELPLGVFRGCTALERIKLSEGTAYIGQQCFQSCTALEEIDIPLTVTDIEAFAFGGCTSLSRVSLPDGLLVIGEFAFDKCEKLTDITIPDTVEKICGDAFNGCYDITVHYRGLDYGYSELDEIYTYEEKEYTVTF